MTIEFTEKEIECLEHAIIFIEQADFPPYSLDHMVIGLEQILSKMKELQGGNKP